MEIFGSPRSFCRSNTPTIDPVEELLFDSDNEWGGVVDPVDKAGGVSFFTGADNDDTELSSVVSKGSVWVEVVSLTLCPESLIIVVALDGLSEGEPAVVEDWFDVVEVGSDKREDVFEVIASCH